MGKMISVSADQGPTERRQGPAELYVGLKNFYARHIKERDAGFTDQWLADFDGNGTLSTNIFDEPAREGREAIGASVHALDNWFAQREIQRRHFIGMLVMTPGEGGTIRTRHYGLLLTTTVADGLAVHSFSVASDLLQYCGGVCRVLSRHIERDDLEQSSRSYVEYDSTDRREETLMTHTPVSERPVERAEIYYSVEQFYAHQMQDLDSGDAAGWAATFTNDGVFSSNGMQNPVTGYGELLTAAQKAIAALASEGIIRRHLVSTLTVEGGDDDSVRVRCYVLVVDTRDGTTALRMSTVMEDLLVFSTVGWLVQERTVYRDGLA